MKKFKVGDKVKIIDPGEIYPTYKRWMEKHGEQFLKFWGRGPIDDFKGNYEIKVIAPHNEFPHNDVCLIQNIDTKRVHMITTRGIEPIKQSFTKADLKDGDILTLRNGRKGQYRGKKTEIEGDTMSFLKYHHINDDLTNNGGRREEFDIVKVERVVYEREETPILDEAERKYLSGIIAPFRNRVKCIKKIHYYDDIYFIKICLDDDHTNLPNFKTDIMYKGMEDNKEYTLEELGL